MATPNPGDAAFSYQILTQLILLDGTYLQEMMKSFKFINETERKVHEAMENMFLVTEKLEKRTVEMQNFFENGFDKLINQTLLIQQDGILRVMVRYGSYVMKELTTNMGMCNIFPETYDNMKGLLCFYLADSVNAIWLSLAIVVFSFIFFSPMYMDLITHYRIAALDFESENGPLTTEASDLKFSIGAARQVSERAENQWM
ncbi:uncharacterized protein LOC130644718 [Hydractinia symbiolongicarpus]|uniref:uncharacterized protein LOC130644718 n=1 Tax=Hydractinia symbiolongicarpus TaxID=13093 RepID=UPI00255136D6|nr:uncharacterized protein LOC130644718 [Hydractinia symbiolongicarpus]